MYIYIYIYIYIYFCQRALAPGVSASFPLASGFLPPPSLQPA